MDNSSTPTTASTPPTTSTASEQLSTTLSNITNDDDSILSDVDANAWAASLLLAPGFDGSGVTTDEGMLLIKKHPFYFSLQKVSFVCDL